MRIFLILSLVLSLTLNLASTSFANDAKAQARKSLEISVTKIMDLIKNPGYKDVKTRQDLNKSIEKEVRATFDFSEFSMRTVGQRWQSFTAEQQSAFTEAFADLLFSTYLDRIDGYNGERIVYTGEVSNKAQTRVEVRTTVTIEKNRTIPVAYRMLNDGGRWRVYDVIVEGISLVKNYRTQFGDILSKESPEELTARVKERALALRNKVNEQPN